SCEAGPRRRAHAGGPTFSRAKEETHRPSEMLSSGSSNNGSLGNRGRMKNFRLEVSSNGERPVVIIKSSQRHTNLYATCAASTPPANPWLDISTALNCED